MWTLRKIKRINISSLYTKNITNKLFKKMYKVEFMKSHGIDLCEDCHTNIHKFFSEKELGRNFNDKVKLLSDERVRRFIRWVRKQD